MVRVNMRLYKVVGKISCLKIGGGLTSATRSTNKVKPIGVTCDAAVGLLPVHCRMVSSTGGGRVGKLRAKLFPGGERFRDGRHHL